MRASAAVAAACIAGLPVQSQTFDEAVRANVALAIELCVDNLGDEERLVAAFASAGFQPGEVGTYGSSTVHRFGAPADTMSVNVLYYSCQIDTTHLGVSATMPHVRGVLDRIAPGRFTETAEVGVSARGGGRPCHGFILRQSDRLPLNIYVGSLGPEPGYACAEDGTARVWFEIPG